MRKGLTIPHNGVIVGSDHRGYALKNYILAVVATLGNSPNDIGPWLVGDVDFPKIAHQAAVTMNDGLFCSILVCGSGHGMCIAANKHPGVRAAVCRTVAEVVEAREHNDINVLCIGANFTTDTGTLDDMVKAFLTTPRNDDPRYANRRELIEATLNL